MGTCNTSWLALTVRSIGHKGRSIKLIWGVRDTREQSSSLRAQKWCAVERAPILRNSSPKLVRRRSLACLLAHKQSSRLLESGSEQLCAAYCRSVWV